MYRKVSLLILALAFCGSPVARAANITWVTESVDITGDGVPDDFAWITWLQSLGHTVDLQRGNWTTLDNTKIAALNAADVVIVSRTATSGSYNDGGATEVAQWSGIKAPIICLHAYFVRNNRWFWVNTATINSLVGPPMEVVVPSHPIFTGINVNAANQVAVVDGTTGTGQTSFIGQLDVGNGTLLAKTGTNAWVVEWQPGKPFYTGSSETPAGKRMLFSAGTQETAPQPQGALNLTDQGKKLLNNAILYLTGKSVVPGLATNPQPAVGQTDVPSDVSLTWTAGPFAKTHDVYVGLSAADVGNATRTNPLGVLAGKDQSAGSFATAGLQFGQTYYWRVDEVNAPPSSAIIKGEIWSFTVEPYSYPIAGKSLTATASNAQNGMGPENTINGSGLGTSDLHGTDSATMWMSTGAGTSWIQYRFDKVYKLDTLLVWNSNGTMESFVGFGAKDVKIEYSSDGTTWSTLPNVPQFARASGMPNYAANTTVSFGGAMAQYVKLTISSNWGGISPVTGLSEVRFSYVPVQARAPQPAAGATSQSVTTILNWRPGRDVTAQKVYFGTDPNAVANGTIAAQTVTTHVFDPGALNFGTTYYWKVDEIGATTYPGEVWSFTTQQFVVVDDFESYDEDNHRIYDTWIDGATDGKSGSFVGYNPTAAELAAGAHFTETTIIHGGKQSMPLEYNNVKVPFYSEATRTFSPAQDWTGNGADTLVLYFQGRAAGFLEKAPGNYVMSGSGTDIWSTADQFRFAFERLTGDGTLVAKVESVVNTDPWAMGAVMIRESLDPGSRFMAVCATFGSGVRFRGRLLAAGTATSDTTIGPPAEQTAMKVPMWIKIERKGSTFNGYFSADGVKWTSMAWNPQTIAMPSAVYLGLAVTSHNAAAVTTVEFSNVATTGNVTGPWTAQAIGVAQPSNDAGQLYVMVQDSAGKSKVANHPDPAATNLASWQEWRIPLSTFTSAGVKVASVKSLIIGVGDRANPKTDGAGLVYLDDIGFGHPVK